MRINTRMRDLLLLIVLSLSLNGLIAALVDNPGYVDAYYYYNGGLWFVRGGPLIEPYLWNYIAAPPSLPAPAFAYWQPLPSMIAALGMRLLPSLSPFDAAQVPYVLLAAVLPLISYAVGSHLGERRHGLLAGLLTIFSGYYVRFWSLPESFTPFAVCGAGALAFLSWGVSEARWWRWLIAGALAGLAHLSRADGILLIGVLGIITLFTHPREQWRVRIFRAGLAVAGYGLAMAPWFARNLTVFSSPQAPGGLSTLWLLHHNDMFLYQTELTPGRYFTAGWGAIARAKLEALAVNLATFVGVQNLVTLTPFTLIGSWRRWRHPWLLPALVYGLALFAAMTFAFTWPGRSGGWLHSSAALVPFITAAGVLGLDDSVRWVAQRRVGWNPAQARLIFGAWLLIMAAAITAWLVAGSIVGLPYSGRIAWNAQNAVYDQIGAALDAADVPPAALVMSNNAPGFYTHTGHGGVPLPSGGVSMLLRAADDYAVEWLVLDQVVPVSLLELYTRESVPNRLALVDTFGSEQSPVYLYRILPAE